MTNQDLNQALLDYLKTHSPSDWHQVAWNWNWDNGIEPLDWVTDQKECDKGTALLIYWSGSPGWNHKYASRKEVPDYEKTTYDLNFKIEKNYLNGFYLSKNIFCDPKDINGTDMTKEYNDVQGKQLIPEAMFKPAPGTKFARGHFIEGYPPEIAEKFDIK